MRFYVDFGGYANEAAIRAPLLHTWSLGVEEQFYLVFPLLMWGINRLTKGRYDWALWLTIAISFVMSVIVVRMDAAQAFYLPQYRAWEFAFGAMVSVGRLPRISRPWLAQILSAAGLVMILASVFLLSDQSLFPGEAALPACLGAALIIYAPCDRFSPMGRVLQNPVATRIGLWSYSLYLVHWPVLIMARYFQNPLPLATSLLLILLTFGLAGLSWRFVEQPFRADHLRLKRREIWLAAWGASVLVVVAGLTIHYYQGFPGRATADQRRFPTLAQQRLSCPGLWSSGALVPCRLGNSSAKPDTLVWGDSFAIAIAEGFDRSFKVLNRALFLVSNDGCPPLLGTRVDTYKVGVADFLKTLLHRIDTGQGGRCRSRNLETLHWLESHPIRNVVLVGRWAYYTEHATDVEKLGVQQVLSDDVAPSAGPEGNGAVFARGLEATLSKLTQDKKQIFMVDSAPEFGIPIPYEIALRRRWGKQDILMPRAQYEKRQQTVARISSVLARKYAFQRLRPEDRLCDAKACFGSRDGRSLYDVDGIHLSSWGATVAAGGFDPLWASQPGQL